MLPKAHPLFDAIEATPNVARETLREITYLRAYVDLDDNPPPPGVSVFLA